MSKPTKLRSNLLDYKIINLKNYKFDQTKHPRRVSHASTDIDILRSEYENSHETRDDQSWKDERLTNNVNAFAEATLLLGYLSRMKNQEYETRELTKKLNAHRQAILEEHSGELSIELTKQIVIPSPATELYRQGILKFERVRDYIIYRYRKKLYKLLSSNLSDSALVANIKEIINKVRELNLHYDCYCAIVDDLQKNNSRFASASRDAELVGTSRGAELVGTSRGAELVGTSRQC